MTDYEKNVSAQSDQTGPNPRILKKNVHKTGSPGDQSTQSKRKETVGGLNWLIEAASAAR